MARKNKREWIAVIPGIILVLILLEAGSYIKNDRLVFPSAGEIGREFLELLKSGETWRQVWTTVLHLLKAFALSAVIGTGLGIAEALVPYLHALLKPLMTLLRSVPMIVLIVVLMVLSETFTKYARIPVLAAGLIMVPMISEAAYEGSSRIDPEMKDVYRMNSGINARVIFQVYIPLIGGYMKQAFVNAFAMGLKVIITSEYIVQVEHSLGKAVHTNYRGNEYSRLYAYTFLMILLVILLTGLPQALLRLLEKQKRKEITNG